jgi:hypothetical protein
MFSIGQMKSDLPVGGAKPVKPNRAGPTCDMADAVPWLKFKSEMELGILSLVFKMNSFWNFHILTFRNVCRAVRHFNSCASHKGPRIRS